jgi:hypothetical protein
MRKLLLVLAVLPVATACASTRAPPEPIIDDKIQTTQDANRDGLGGAVSAPLRDVNLVRTKIPPVLLEAMKDPYARPPRVNCAVLIAQVTPLDAALGEDLDAYPPEEDEDLMDRGRRAAGRAALGAVASAAQDLVPFRGWVRKLSGAERHDRLVQTAITSGQVRRAYLKGLGESRGCNPPATPQHQVAKAPEIPLKDRKPRYPTRVDPEPPVVPAQPADR